MRSLALFYRKTRLVLLLLLLLLLFVMLIAAAVVSILLLTCRSRCYFSAVCRCSSVGVVRAYWATIMKNGELWSFVLWRQFSGQVALWGLAPLAVLEWCGTDTSCSAWVELIGGSRHLPLTLLWLGIWQYLYFTSVVVVVVYVVVIAVSTDVRENNINESRLQVITVIV